MRAVALVANLALAPVVSVIRGSGKAEAKVMAVQILKEMTADTACQPMLVEKGAVRWALG
jgi:hypothetical protein